MPNCVIITAVAPRKANEHIVGYCHNHLLKYAPFEVNIVTQDKSQPRRILSMYRNLLTLLDQVDIDSTVYVCEHDCIYPPDYFDPDPFVGESNSAVFRYAGPRLMLGAKGYSIRPTPAISGLICRDVCAFQKSIKRKMAMLRSGERLEKCEPGFEDGFGRLVGTRKRLAIPYLDVRIAGNHTTGHVWRRPFWDHPHWGEAREWLRRFEALNVEAVAQ